MKLIVISGSTRRASYNTRLARLVAEVRPEDDVDVISDLDALPFYDADVEAMGVPDAVSRLRAAVADAGAVIMVTPEYNGTVPGLLGNAVDWLSRPHRHSVLTGRSVLVLSASPSRFGAVRAAQHLRQVLATIGAVVAPDGLSVAAAHQRLGAGRLDPDLPVQLADSLRRGLEAVKGESASTRTQAAA